MKYCDHIERKISVEEFFVSVCRIMKNPSKVSFSHDGTHLIFEKDGVKIYSSIEQETVSLLEVETDEEGKDQVD